MPPHLIRVWVGSLRVLVFTYLLLAGQTALAQEAEAQAAEEQAPAPKTETSPADLQRARRIFARGVELASEGAYSRAALKFEEALAIYPAPAVEYNLASALFELRRYDDSYNAVTHILNAEGVSDEVRGRAAKLEQTLRARVARLTVVLGGSPEDAQVLVDGVQLTEEQIGVTRAIPAGRHRVEAVRAGSTLSTRNIDIPLRTAAFVDVSMIPSAEREVIREVIVAAEPEPAAPLAEPSGHSSWARNRWLWGGVAALAIVGGATATLLLWPSDDPKEAQPVSGTLEPGVITWP